MDVEAMGDRVILKICNETSDVNGGHYLSG